MSKILKIRDPVRGETLTGWKSYLASEYSEGRPVRILAELPSPVTRDLGTKEIEALLGPNRMWANSGDVSVSVYDTIKHGYVLTGLDLTGTVSGDGDATVLIERDGNYPMARPDETEFDGFDGETIAIKNQNGGTPFSFGTDDLIGSLDDGASYKLVATLKDDLGQSSGSYELPFRVDWDHQAVEPEAQVYIDYNYNAAYIKPIAPEGYAAGDTVDIYRLSSDKPVLIYSGAQFGETYVDPYPTIGEFGGHRIVFKTKYGDYITDENNIAWLDLNREDGDILNIWGVLIDFDGYQLHLKYDIKLSNDWKKDFTETHYLGGSVQGDWNPSIGRTASVTTTTIVEEDAENISLLRRLANYPGHCHIRTPDGSSFTADIQVKEDREEKMINKKASFSLSITRVDPAGFDMVEYGRWRPSIELEEE